MIEMTIRKLVTGALRITCSNHICFKKTHSQALGASPYEAQYSRDCGGQSLIVASPDYQAETIASFIVECRVNKLPFDVDIPANHRIYWDEIGCDVALTMALSETDVKTLLAAVERRLTDLAEKPSRNWFSGPNL